MTFTRALAPLRRHLLSLVYTVLLLTVFSALYGVPLPLALVLWVAASLLSLEIWRRFEPFLLRRLGCRLPNRLECERFQPVLASACVEVQVLDVAEPWLATGLRSVVVTRALLDLLEDRALVGILAQASEQVRRASLAGELVVWLGNLPLVCAWRTAGWLVDLGRLLAVAVGGGLVLPMLLWPVGFTRWAGRVFGVVFVVLLGSALLSSGFTGPGVSLLLAWPLVRGLAALLGWERRQAEAAADDATMVAGLGWQLVEALETLAWAESLPEPDGFVGLLRQPATPVADRADRVWKKLAAS